MAKYLIKYLDSNANKHQAEFDGNTKSVAIENSKLSAEQIISVNLIVTLGSTELKLDIQELIISEIRALSKSGQAMGAGLKKILKRSGVAKKTTLGVDDGKTVSEILSDVGMSKAVVAVIAAGESSSRLDSALNSSLAYLASQKKIRNQVKTPFTEGVIIISLATLMIMELPGIVAPALATLNSGELSIDTNFLTDIMLGINAYHGEIWLGILGFIATMFGAKQYIWPVLKVLPIFDALNEFFVLRRSVLLLIILRPLFESGIPLNKSLNIIKSSMTSNTDVEAMNAVIDKMGQGKSLSATIQDEEYWSPILYNSFATFEQAVLSAQLELMDTITYALLSRLTIVTGSISTTANLLGKLMGFFALLMLVIGYYFPSLTASA